MEAWSFLAGRMQAGINRAVGMGSESSHTNGEYALGAAAASLGVWRWEGGRCGPWGLEMFLPGNPRLSFPVGRLLYRPSSHPKPWSCVLALTHGRGLASF